MALSEEVKALYAAGLRGVNSDVVQRTETPEFVQVYKDIQKYGVKAAPDVLPTSVYKPKTEYRKTAGDLMWERGSQSNEPKSYQAKMKANSAKKKLDDYLQSDEYKQKQAERNQKANEQRLQQSIMDAIMGNPGGTQIQPEADPTETQLRAAYDQAQAEADAAENEDVMAMDLEAITGLSNEDRKLLEQYAVNQIRDQNLPMEMAGVMPTAQQEANPLIQKYGKQRVDELAETYMRQQNAELAQKVEESARQEVTGGFWNGVGKSLKTVPIAALSGVVGTVGQLQGAARHTGRYTSLDPNATGTIGDVYTGAIRGQVAQNIEGEDPTLLSKGLSIGYQGLMSAADSIARAYLGGGALGGAALAATGSFSQTMADASRQGATPAQAALLATATAGIEAASEKIPLDDLIKTAKGGGAASVLKNVFRQMGIEATTEEVSLLGSLLAEAAILQEKSGYQQTVTAQLMLGKSTEEAQKIAAQEIWEEVINTAAVSAVAGIGGGVSASYANEANLFAKNGAPEAVNQPKKQTPEQMKQAAIENNRARHEAMVAEEDAQAPQSVTRPQTEAQPQQPTTEAQQPQQTTRPVQQAQTAPQQARSWIEISEELGNNSLKEMFQTEKGMATENSVGYRARNAALAELQADIDSGLTSEQLKAKAAEMTDIVNNLNNTQELTASQQMQLDIAKEMAAKYSEAAQKNAAAPPAAPVVDGAVPAQDFLKATGEKYAQMVPPETPAPIPEGLRDFDNAAAIANGIEPKQAQKTAAPEETMVNVKSAGTALTEQNMVDSQGNYVRIEESPSGNSKYGVTDGAENSGKAGMPMGPEGLSEGSNPSTTTAEPMPLPINSIPANGEEVNGNSVNSESTPTTDTQNQSAEGGQQTDGAGAPTQNFTGTAAYDDLLSDDNVQRERRGDKRHIEVPKTDADGRQVSELVGNSMNSKLTPASFTDSIKKLVQEGQVSHDVQTNEESLRKAAESIVNDGGVFKSVLAVGEVAQSGKTSPEDIAKATLLYQELTTRIDNAIKAGEEVDPDVQSMAEETYVALSQLATNSGRALQLFNLFRKMTPESQVNVLKKEVTQELKKLQKRGTVKKDYQPQFNQELMDEYRAASEDYQKAKDSKAKKAAAESMEQLQNAVYAWEAAQMPTTFKAKWDAWRYMAMLGNVKTQVRNIAGNALMMPYTDVKRKIGALMEKGISKNQRTKAVFQDRELLAWAKQDRGEDIVKGALENSAKLGDDVKNTTIAENLKTFGDGWAGERLNDMQSLINKVVSGGDILFKNREYAQSLAGFLKARGYTAADVQNNLVSQDVLNEARNYAVNEALKATFNDSNMLSDALSSLRYNGDNKALQALNTLGEGLMPFRKTPANVVMRFKDYSPAGLVQGLWNMAANVRNGKVSAATAIDQISSGLTGTGAMLLGYALAGGLSGIKLTGSGTSEDEERQGHQDYALEFSVNGQDYSYKIDWASPANLPMFLGANLRAAWEAEDTSSFYTAVMNIGLGALEPLLELSCMSSMNDLFEGIRYAGEGEALYTAISKMATSYFTQGVPSLVRQTSQAAQEAKQTTFVTSDDPVIQKGQKFLASLPGGQYKTDKVNAWGGKETEENWMTRAFNAYANPGTLKKIDNSELEQEISRLNEVQSTNVTPPTAPKVISYTDRDGNEHLNQRLTEEQYQTLATTQGQTAKSIVSDLINSKDYTALSDEQKAQAINLAYSYARETGEQAAFPDSQGYSQSWMMELDSSKSKSQYILNRVGGAMLSGAMGKLDVAWDNNYNAENEKSLGEQLKNEFDAYAKMSTSAKKAIYDEATGTTKKYIEARQKGVSHDDFLKTAKAINNVKGTGKYDPDTGKNAVRDIDKREVIADMPGLSEASKDKLMRAYMTDYDPTDESPTKTEPKYDFIREEMGLSASRYADSYRAYLDAEGTRYEKNQKIMAATGCDYNTADKLRKLYGGNYKGHDWTQYLYNYTVK